MHTMRFENRKKKQCVSRGTRACKTLNISKSGFYTYLQRKPSKRDALFSGIFQAILRKHKVISSASRKGNLYDNALMESSYKTLKRELIHDANFGNPEQAQLEIFKYILRAIEGGSTEEAEAGVEASSSFRLTTKVSVFYS